MKGFLHRIKSAPDCFTLFVVLAVIAGSIFHYRFWNDPNHVIVHDVVLYYEYLPAAFIYKDLSMSFTEKTLYSLKIKYGLLIPKREKQ
jgi:hypothetical protein